MEIDKLRELFADIDVNVEDLSDKEVIEVAQTIITATIQLASVYTQFVMDSTEALREFGSKLAALKGGSDESES